MFTVANLLVATGGTLLRGDAGVVCTGVSTDSRTLQPGDLFVALVGPRFDGHRFAAAAVERGASAVVIAEAQGAAVGRQLATAPARQPEVPLVAVADPLTALGDIAQAHRRRLTATVVAVTGSSGKTTTKELIATLLRRRYRVLSNEGTQNNLIGVPKTLLRARPEHQVIVVECGTNQPGEIARLTQIAQPQIGVITTLGPAHLEGLGSVEGVRREKRALLEGLAHPGTAVLNMDDPVLRQWLRELPDGVQPVGYGCHPDAAIGATDPAFRNGTMQFRINDRWPVTWSLLGRHNVANALAACSVARLFDVSWEEICEALRTVEPLRGRLCLVRVGRVTIIDDAYNANPLSVRRALEVLREFPTAGRRLFVFGDMGELGAAAPEWHRQVGHVAAQVAQVIVTVGELAALAADAARQHRPLDNGVYRCRGQAEAVERLRALLQPDDVVLVKGSHASGMHRVVEALERSYTAG